MNSQTFGEKIREARLNSSLSLGELASLINYDEKLLSKVERGLLPAPENRIEPLSNTLNINYKELMIKYLSEKIFSQVTEKDYAKEAIEVVLKKLEKGEKGTKEVKKREDVFREIKQYFSTKPIEKAWIFGSFARETESAGSDIDILVQFKKPNKITLFDLVEMKAELEQTTGRDVDLVEEGQVLEAVQQEIAKEKILIYG